jgi:hypothetical protein
VVALRRFTAASLAARLSRDSASYSEKGLKEFIEN